MKNVIYVCEGQLKYHSNYRRFRDCLILDSDLTQSQYQLDDYTFILGEYRVMFRNRGRRVLAYVLKLACQAYMG